MGDANVDKAVMATLIAKRVRDTSFADAVGILVNELSAVDRRGYARCQADVVAWLRSPNQTRDSRFESIPPSPREMADEIEQGEHVGAAADGKGGGE